MGPAASMRDKHVCVLTTTESRAMILYHLKAFKPPGGLGCCPFYGGGSVVVNLLFGVLPIGCGGQCLSLLCITLCFCWFCNHFEDLERVGCFAFIVLQMSCYCKCSVILPHGAVGWSVVCDCSISCSY